MVSDGSATAQPASVAVTHPEEDKLPSPSPTIRRGTEVARYLVLDALGSGGMGRVFSAHDRELDRRVAIKVLFEGRATHTSSGANQLLREGRALASLRHPNIVSVYDIGWHEGELFIAMEYVEGKTFDTWQRDNKPSARELLHHYLEAGAALAAAHDAGIIHGDFKPANVMVDSSGRTVVLDFGLARTRMDPETLRDGSQDGATHGAGTPAYMAPEQHCYERATPASDQFAFCVALYEAFVGKRPFPQRGLIKLTQAVLDGAYENPGAKMPGWVWREVERGLQLAPGDRHPDMRALLRALDPVRQRRRSLGLAGAGLGVLAAAGTVSMLGGPAPCTAASEQLTGVWDADIRRALDRQYVGAPAWPAIREQLDAFEARWSTAWRESCEATHIHETQSEALLDQRMACLHADRVVVEAFVQQLERGGRDVLQRAATRPALGRDSNRCRTQAILRQVPPPPPGPERDRYDTLLQVAAQQYAAATLANDAQAALQVLEAVALDTSTHPSVTHAVEHSRAEALRQLDRTSEARDAWLRAARAADRARDDVAFVQVASVLGFVEASELDRIPAGEVWMDRATSRAESLDLSHHERFNLGLRGAVVLRHQGESNRAVEQLEALLESEGPFLGPGQTGTLHNNLGDLYSSLREHKQAETEFRLAIEQRSQALGDDHREVGHSRFMLGRTLIELGQLDSAQKQLESAAAIFANVEGGAAERVMARESRAILEAMRGDPLEAERMMVEVLALASESLTTEDRRLASLHINHGRMLMMIGRLDEAVAEVRLGLELEERVVKSDHPDLVDGLSLLAQLELARGEAQLAESLATRASKLAADATTRLELGVAALMCQAHAVCDPAAAQSQARVRIDSAEGISEEARAGLRASLVGWGQAIAEFPPCAPNRD
ncbi:MAG: protein kinase domain-containing protein [Nannocystales bacterium]